jgi:hypothetical protein
VVVDIPGHLPIWLTSDEAKFLKNKPIWTNWDVEELKRAEEIQNSRLLN